MNRITGLLTEAASPFEGDYDGWEAEVVKPPSTG
jgi:hypothetical protein